MSDSWSAERCDCAPALSCSALARCNGVNDDLNWAEAGGVGADIV